MEPHQTFLLHRDPLQPQQREERSQRNFLHFHEASMCFHKMKQDLLINIVFNVKEESSAVSFAFGLHVQPLCQAQY